MTWIYYWHWASVHIDGVLYRETCVIGITNTDFNYLDSHTDPGHALDTDTIASRGHHIMERPQPQTAHPLALLPRIGVVITWRTLLVRVGSGLQLAEYGTMGFKALQVRGYG